MRNNNITYSKAINKALIWSMSKDKKMLCYGLGLTDPKKIFSTTVGLLEKFGEKRVFDVPCSENALTGISIGSSLNGVRSVVTHQRLDFFLLAMDQLVNSAAKWFYMYGSQLSVPITIRLIIGRGWGQGPTHSQNLQALFNHIPGLKVVMPTFPNDARNLLISSIFDPNPVLFLEHRWLHETSEKEKKINITKIGKAKKILEGSDITIVACSYLTIEAVKAAKFLKKNYNINSEVIDLISIKPLDHALIEKSVKKTKRLLVVDSGFFTGSIANDIIYNVISTCFKILKSKPVKLAMPDVPEPTSFALTKDFYITHIKIFKTVLKIFNINKKLFVKKDDMPHDVPGNWFKGPF
jgi:pyruvate/2-oxoglutarate/acetoin dehydrogenase E1 component